jgi:hypothetical protein
LLTRARLVNQNSSEQFSYDFTSILISFLASNDIISEWFKKYVKEAGIHYEDILRYKDIDQGKLDNSRASACYFI